MTNEHLGRYYATTEIGKDERGGMVIKNWVLVVQGLGCLFTSQE